MCRFIAKKTHTKNMSELMFFSHLNVKTDTFKYSHFHILMEIQKKYVKNM